MRTVIIDAVLNGWTVKCGCQIMVYTDPEKLLQDLGEYMRDPQAKEKAVTSSAVNKRLIPRDGAGPRQVEPPEVTCMGTTTNAPMLPRA